MPNIKLILQYDGTNYSGWQAQKNSIPIQSTLENAIYDLISEKVKIVGCSRTDAGVHALEYVCNFACKTIFSRWVAALNSKLPADIRILYAQNVSNHFNARFDCKSKTYTYKIYNSKINNPILRNYTYFCHRGLNLENITLASEFLIGKHDFSAFTNHDPSRILHDKICDISALSCTRDETDKNIIKFKITGNRFLYKMVRNIVGTLLKVGYGKIEPDSISKILESRDRTLAGATVPAHGLYLYRVDY